MNDLAETAQKFGIELNYFDVSGRRHEAGEQTLARLIAAMLETGVPPRGDEAPAEFMRAFQGDGRRLWALAIQLYALRSARNWGHGDFTDLARLIALAAARGVSAVGLNPLHALFPDRAEEASPYAPNSRIFLNPLYIDVEAIAEFPGLAAGKLDADVAALRDGDLIAYERVAAAKMRGLHLAYAAFRRSATPERRADFDAYRAAQGEALLRFACFEVLRRQFAPKPWMEWPQPWRNPALAQIEEFRRANAEACEFHEFVQWTADRQLAACQAVARKAGMPIGLYIDIAVGIDRAGADAWSQQDAVLAGVSMGAPPDEFQPSGQDWGLAPFNPHALARDDFAPLRRVMRAAMHHAGAVRIDHVLGLKRQFMVPLGMTAADGAYVRFPFEWMLRVVAEESHRFNCIVIGEDLGTVPEYFRETMAGWGLWGYRVMLFEREWDGCFKPPHAYPAETLATFNTHDLPTFKGWLAAHDLAIKRGMGLDPGEGDEARDWARHKLREILGSHGQGEAADDLAAVAAFLAATPSRLVTVGLDDVMGALDQVNVPGTVHQHPNWRRKMPVPLEELDGHAGFARIAAVFARGGRSFSKRP
jgi:4-alpha-glucanotransferase